ncbi:MAG TPA: SUF system Fe-S cluster assembly protein [Bryobacteraceae bacterium]|jgi:FeS assembly SUF system protein|nr:SUF system Fe-S cluster assembly protein [Bryobacteraceae bacterium]
MPESNEADTDILRQKVIQVLRQIHDPEIPVNIYELGLIYDLSVAETGEVKIQMTLTAPSCPVAGSLPPEVKSRVEALPGVKEVEVELTWDPPWSMDRMSDAARLQLGIEPVDDGARVVRFEP